MAIKDQHPLAGEMLQGTLDLLILQTLVLGPAHGHTIAHAIERRSEDALQGDFGEQSQGPLLPAHCRWDRLVHAVNRVLRPAED